MGIDLDMALRLDRMASLVTGVEIRSYENNYNQHRDEYDVISASKTRFWYGSLLRHVSETSTKNNGRP